MAKQSEIVRAVEKFYSRLIVICHLFVVYFFGCACFFSFGVSKICFFVCPINNNKYKKVRVQQRFLFDFPLRHFVY